MASDFILELEGIPGECKKSGFEDKISIDSWSHSIHRSGYFGTGGGGTSGAASVADISITKVFDASSPPLELLCLNGKHIASGKIYCRKSIGDKEEVYLEITMTDIVVTNFSDAGGGGDLLHESVSFNVGKFEKKYKMQKEDGSLEDKGEVKWDVQKAETF